MTNHANHTQVPPGWPQAAPGVAPPPERPDGSYVKLTRTGWDGRQVVSILVREDNPDNPDEPHRWRAAEGNSRWLTWQDLHAAGRVDPLYSHAELAAAAAERSPAPTAQAVAPAHRYQQPHTPERLHQTTSTTSATTRDEHRARSASAAPPDVAHRASRPDPHATPTAHPASRLDSRPNLAAAPADHPVRKVSP